MAERDRQPVHLSDLQHRDRQRSDPQHSVPQHGDPPDSDLLESDEFHGHLQPEIFFRVLAVPVIYLLIFIGLHLFLRGHNAPGGGFIAGLVVASAGLLSRMVRHRPLLVLAVQQMVPVGLLIALLTGAVPLALGRPFLTSAHGEAHGPLIGEFAWATATLFDFGVFLVVVGTTLTIIDLLSESPVRELYRADNGQVMSKPAPHLPTTPVRIGLDRDLADQDDDQDDDQDKDQGDGKDVDTREPNGAESEDTGHAPSAAAHGVGPDGADSNNVDSDNADSNNADFNNADSNNVDSKHVVPNHADAERAVSGVSSDPGLDDSLDDSSDDGSDDGLDDSADGGVQRVSDKVSGDAPGNVSDDVVSDDGANATEMAADDAGEDDVRDAAHDDADDADDADDDTRDNVTETGPGAGRARLPVKPNKREDH